MWHLQIRPQEPTFSCFDYFSGDMSNSDLLSTEFMWQRQEDSHTRDSLENHSIECSAISEIPYSTDGVVDQSAVQDFGTADSDTNNTMLTPYYPVETNDIAMAFEFRHAVDEQIYNPAITQEYLQEHEESGFQPVSDYLTVNDQSGFDAETENAGCLGPGVRDISVAASCAAEHGFAKKVHKQCSKSRGQRNTAHHFAKGRRGSVEHVTSQMGKILLQTFPRGSKRCPLCKARFTRSADARRHVTSVHTIYADKEIRGELKESRRRWCSKCPMILARPDARKRHEGGKKCKELAERMAKENFGMKEGPHCPRRRQRGGTGRLPYPPLSISTHCM